MGNIKSSSRIPASAFTLITNLAGEAPCRPVLWFPYPRTHVLYLASVAQAKMLKYVTLCQPFKPPQAKSWLRSSSASKSLADEARRKYCALWKNLRLRSASRAGTRFPVPGARIPRVLLTLCIARNPRKATFHSRSWRCIHQATATARRCRRSGLLECCRIRMQPGTSPSWSVRPPIAISICLWDSNPRSCERLQHTNTGSVRSILASALQSSMSRPRSSVPMRYPQG
jgi:hypothetical protein